MKGEKKGLEEQVEAQLATGERLREEISSLSKMEVASESRWQLEEEVEKMEQLMVAIEQALRVRLSKLLGTYAPQLKGKVMSILEETFHP